MTAFRPPNQDPRCERSERGLFCSPCTALPFSPFGRKAFPQFVEVGPEDVLDLLPIVLFDRGAVGNGLENARDDSKCPLLVPEKPSVS